MDERHLAETELDLFDEMRDTTRKMEGAAITLGFVLGFTSCLALVIIMFSIFKNL